MRGRLAFGALLTLALATWGCVYFLPGFRRLGPCLTLSQISLLGLGIGLGSVSIARRLLVGFALWVPLTALLGVQIHSPRQSFNYVLLAGAVVVIASFPLLFLRFGGVRYDFECCPAENRTSFSQFGIRSLLRWTVEIACTAAAIRTLRDSPFVDATGMAIVMGFPWILATGFMLLRDRLSMPEWWELWTAFVVTMTLAGWLRGQSIDWWILAGPMLWVLVSSAVVIRSFGYCLKAQPLSNIPQA